VEDALTSTGRGDRILKQLDMLALIIEEQRCRLDSIIAGSTIIPTIQNEIAMHRNQIGEIQEFLNLPQCFNLQQLLRSAFDLEKQRVSTSLSAYDADLSGLRSKVQCLERSQVIADMRLKEFLHSSKHVGANLADEETTKSFAEREASLHRELMFTQHQCNEHEVRLVALEEMIKSLREGGEETFPPHTATDDAARKAKLESLLREVSSLSDHRLKKDSIKRTYRSKAKTSAERSDEK
jgi:hypothetical protein